jgi:hypothetical protein
MKRLGIWKAEFFSIEESQMGFLMVISKPINGLAIDNEGGFSRVVYLGG